jgi:hypothetical protein
MPTPQVFISYRRDDTAGYARAIGDALGRQFGAERVFIDVDDIAAGQRFDEVIHQAVGGSRVLLVLIGRRWLGERSGQPARIHDPADLVQREVASALASGMQVLPLLVDGAAMPDPALLPASLQALTGRQALAIDNSRFAADLQRLIETLRPLLDPAPAPVAGGPGGPDGPGGRRWVAGGVAIGLLALALALWAGLRPAVEAPVARPPSPSSAVASAVRPAVNGVWQAEVVYDWPNAHFSERFDFSGDGQQLQGSASFLRVARSIDQGKADASGLQFVTRSTEVAGATTRDIEHRYQGQLVGDELRLTMLTVGASTPHAPVQIVARRVPAGLAASQASAAPAAPAAPAR